MEVTKAPPPDVGLSQRPENVAASKPDLASLLVAPPPPSDRVDIQPLTVTSALQILISEVRAGLQVPVAAPAPAAQSAVQSAQIVLDLLLQSLPAEPGAPGVVTPGVATPGVATSAVAPDDAVAVAAADAALGAALDRAIATVEVWRHVPHAVVEAAREARGLIAAMLNDEPPSALWGRPEWEWLAPRIQRYWRRRRPGRRSTAWPTLSDPDLTQPQDPVLDGREPRPR
jgi:hypothetical protein